MRRLLPHAFALLAALTTTAACTAPATQTDAATAVTTTPIAGFVTDLASFDAFIASTPTPEQFKARYPDVTLVLPGSIATKETFFIFLGTWFIAVALVHLLQRRTAARADKDYATADQLSLCSEYTHKHKSVNKHTHTRKKGSNA